ncbi:RNA polymerase sigma factor [Pedobacter immunditicola]|uniref:RNA polymerase sigma factor n=1 Tax=Pedobacter immunditicola TaxID=3133440 RepID=UPI0030AD6A56
MEKILISAIKSGNNDVLLKIYKQYRNDFIRWAISNYKVSMEQAKLVYKEVLIAFYEKINAGALTACNGDIRTYLFQKARIRLIRISKTDRNIGSQPVVMQKYVTPHSDLYLNQLSSNCRMVIQLFYINGLPLREVAETMGFNDVAAVKKKRFECFQQLMELINMKQQHEEF